MRASKNGLSLTIIFAMILSNVIDIKESQACPGAIGVGIGAWGSTGRSLQSLEDDDTKRFLEKVVKAEIDFINNTITAKELQNEIFSDGLSCEADDEDITMGFCGENPEEFWTMQKANWLRQNDESMIMNFTTKIELCNEKMSCNFKVLNFFDGKKAMTDVVTLNSDSSKIKDIRILTNGCWNLVSKQKCRAKLLEGKCGNSHWKKICCETCKVDVPTYGTTRNVAN